jgi:hypothetical protein
MNPNIARFLEVTRRMPGWSLPDTRLRAMVWALTAAWNARGLTPVRLGPPR